MKSFKEKLLTELFVMEEKYGIDLSDQKNTLFQNETIEYRKIFELEYKLDKLNGLVDHIYSKIEEQHMETNMLKEELKKMCMNKAINRPLHAVYIDIRDALKVVGIPNSYDNN